MTDDADRVASLVALTTEIVTAYVSNNSLAPDALPSLITSTYAAVAGLTAAPVAAEDAAAPAPAVSVRKSLASREHIVSLIDGKPYRTLKRHLAGHGLTPQAYRERYGLPADYPMVAPAYSEHRRAVAKQLGLGRRRTPTTPEAPAKATRKPRAKAATPTAPA